MACRVCCSWLAGQQQQEQQLVWRWGVILQGFRKSCLVLWRCDTVTAMCWASLLQRQLPL
jgi:hypothetical protein